MIVKPQRVDSTSWVYWLKEGLRLSGRNTFWFVVFGAAFSFLGGIPDELLYVPIYASPFFMGLLCLFARASDEGSSVYSALSRVSIVSWASLYLASQFAFIFLLLVAKILGAFLEQGSSSAELGASEGTFGTKIMLLQFWMMLTSGPILWFLTPLLVVRNVPPWLAVKQAINAIMINKFVLVFIFGVATSCVFFASISGVLAVPWFAIVGCAMYVSYRHIWCEPGNKSPMTSRNQIKQKAAA